jgi:cyclic beta-1,2-glucan synthetase
MILNNEELQTRAHEFALMHEASSTKKVPKPFWPAFRSDLASLHEFAEQLQAGKPICTQPAEDWLLDHINFIETQAQVVVREMPRAVLKKLPRLNSTGMPRIYELCSDYLEHVGGKYDSHSFEEYVMSYQEVSILKDVECWALINAMRVIIIRRLAVVMRDVRNRHNVCHKITSILDQIGSKNMSADKIRAVLEREARENPLGPVEIVHFVQHLREWEPNIQIVHDWLKAYVENSEKNLEQMVSLEHQLQAELQVTCGYLVQSLHLIERLPWRLTFTKISKLEKILLSDPNHDFEQMDLASRDLLRSRAAKIAYQLNVPETLVAQTAINLSKSNKTSDILQPREACLAYYLLDPHGINLLRKDLCRSTRPRVLPQVAVLRRPSASYIIGTIILFAALMLLAGQWVSYGISIRALSQVAIVLALLLPVSEWTITIIHDLIVKCCNPTILLRYDYSKKLPAEAATMVVMPIIWSSIEEVEDVVDRLLVHYLANRQDNIYFAILADFADAKSEVMLNDKEIVTYAEKRINELRKKYGENKFFLFHRKRLYNSVDNIYMGWERKRGKLVEFVELINGNKQTSFSIIDGAAEILPTIRYVFTTDHDTQLPIGIVGRLAGTIHFPYNRPRLNAEETSVVEGFGVLQPRIGSSFESTQKSRFSALLSGKPGIDPYAFAVSDAYQDLFGQGIFVGKGIFEVEAFQKTLVNRIPDFHVLSHDLLEGGFLRAGLTSDIEVVESHPGTIYAYQQRAHRWIRGDWQLIKWLGRSCKDRNGESKKVGLCGLTRWQIIDNLRRSLMAPALFITAILGIDTLPGRGWVWETIVMITIFLPFLRDILAVVFGQNLNSLATSFKQCFLMLLALPFSTILSLDAIIRTLHRIFVSKKNLLEWVPSAKTDRRSANGKVFMYEGVGYIAGIIFVAVCLLTGGAFGWFIGSVGLILLLLAKPIFQQFNKPQKSTAHEWLGDASSELNELSLKIWSFYDRYVTEQESYLPPDNVQYHPSPKETIAHRTSPTNIGLYLACVLAARDLGFIGTAEMLKRIGATLETIHKMEKWNGHLLNWYDTCSAKPLFPRYVSTVDSGNFIGYLMVVRQGLLELGEQESGFGKTINELVLEIDQIIEQTNFESLYNADERLFSLGYHVDTNRKDTTLYDLLASEARQASFVAIALGQIPASHWFSLARTMSLSEKHKILLSWSGTMFEYLMPSLIMRTYQNTIWDSTYRGVVKKQRNYAEKYQIPFGISESGYFAFDYQLNYQYRAFGVPGVGLDRGLGQNLVVAPYATIMSLPFAGNAALDALHQFEKLDAKGEFGFFEAVDFTTGRMPKGERYQVIKSYMAHHQGMSMLTLANLLTEEKMIKRFHADLRVRAADLLLQERIPEKITFIEEPIGLKKPFPVFEGPVTHSERTFTGQTLVPEVNVLSNSRMTSINSTNGTGMLTWNGLSISRWIEDPVVDTSGPLIYLHDVTKDDTWSITRFPCENVQDGKSTFRLDHTVYEGTYHDITSELEITVSPDIDAEVRRLKVVNNSDEERILEVTTFLELALAEPSAVNAHPAFSKLFIETSHEADAQCLLAKKRRREDEEQEAWAVHSVYVEGDESGDYEFETDRAKFIGRGYSLQKPKATHSRLRGLVGSVVDPAFIMRRRIHLPPKESVIVFIITGAAESKEKALDIIQQLQSPNRAERTFHMAWVRSQIDLRHRHLTGEQATVAQMLAGRLLFTPPLSALRSEAIEKNKLGQSSLWSHGVSGDVPVAMVTIDHLADLPFIVLLACQHQYLCLLGMEVDLVVLDETIGGYQDQLMNLLRDQLAARGMVDLKRIIALKAEHLSEEERILLRATARVELKASGPSISAQLRIEEASQNGPKKVPTVIRKAQRGQQTSNPNLEREFFNGWGGFVEDGQAYQILVQPGAYLPRPWSNVIANQRFGSLITDFGTGYTWWQNSRECKLTPWTNDPVLDQPGECIYFRDLQTDQIWSAAPKPAGDQFTYLVTHGKGYSRFEQLDGDVVHKMEVTVPLNDTLKIIKLNLRNSSRDRKQIAVTYYAEWVLGVTREMQAPYIVSEWDEDHQALLARNAYQETFRDAISFMHIASPDYSGQLAYTWTGDRTEFIGKGGTLNFPAALLKKSLSKRAGTFSNTCSALQTIVDLDAGEEVTLTLLMGCEASKEEVFRLINQYSQPSSFTNTISSVDQYWQKTLGQIQIKTPDRAMDIMMNGWLLYQTLACRLWARTAFYQAGGAFGFRDQLQDSLAFLHVDPAITRKQILINAAHQYQEGDVQHWWHQETDKGIRTKFSDDLLWLPYTVSRYIEQTGDKTILDEIVPFLHSDVLKEEELERYENTVVSEETGTLLEHCLRAIRHGLKFGEHGIPLMGIGDWNDGMSRIGAKGRGESVWLGWFLLDILKRFITLGKETISDIVIEQYEQAVHDLERNLNRNAWDGSWFRRAFTDTGEWIGTSKHQECRIDAIAQSWSVISQGTDRERQQRAMFSFDRELVDRELNLARLLTKPFNRSKPSPGYIQGYPPGIRENGGQYTHGVIWGIVAWAMLERHDKAFELFSMLNPINHTLTFRDVQIYENEPFVMSADVYTASPHQGRGGWSWYTGAAGWMYQAGLEYVLGVKLHENQLSIQPCVPADWKSFSIDYRFGKTIYSLEVYCQHEHGVPVKWVVDGKDAETQPFLELVDDEKTHQVEVYIGKQRTSTVG